MNYVCLTNSLDEQMATVFKNLCTSPKLSPLLDCDLKESIRNWQSIKDELLNKKVPNDILDEVEKFIKSIQLPIKKNKIKGQGIGRY